MEKNDRMSNAHGRLVVCMESKIREKKADWGVINIVLQYPGGMMC